MRRGRIVPGSKGTLRLAATGKVVRVCVIGTPTKAKYTVKILSGEHKNRVLSKIKGSRILGVDRYGDPR